MARYGTTHSSPRNGHGKRQLQRPFARPVNRAIKGQPIKGKTAPWFLKQFGSRPAYKVKQMPVAAQAA